MGTGLLKVTQASRDPAQGCTPNGTGTPCDDTQGVPEGSYARGIAVVNGQIGRFTLHLVSHYWPNPQNLYDTATLTLCVGAGCQSYEFYGELHHEPS